MSTKKKVKSKAPAKKVFVDQNNEISTQWQVKTGAGIGGPDPFVAPETFTITPAQDVGDWLEVTIDGAGYTCGMAALQRPLQPFFNPAAVLFALEYDIQTDTNAPTAAQAIETTVRISTADGYNYIGGGQLNYEGGGMFQIYTEKVPWLDTGIKQGKYTPHTTYHVKWNHLLNTVAHTLSVPSIEVNGVVHSVPASMQNVPGQLLKWTAGVYLQ